MEIHFGITGESFVFRFVFTATLIPIATDIQTGTFPIPTAIFKSRKSRQFYVSATDERITKDTTQAPIEGQSLHWNEILDGL